MLERNGFTQIEVLLTAAILGILAAVAVPVIGHMSAEGYKAQEVALARTLISGYQAYAADNDGVLMSGYAPQGEVAYDAVGNQIEWPASARYPMRLAPYVGYDLKSFTTARNQAAKNDAGGAHYGLSLAPDLGMNVTFVGGDYGSRSLMSPASPKATERYGSFCAMRMAQVQHPSKLMVFASARESKDKMGNHRIDPPFVTGRRWANGFAEDQSAESFGFVDLRYSGRAVVAMLDGHVELLDEDQLQDMRYWSIQAAEADDPNYTLKRQ